MESEEHSGASHFLEQMVCKGTRQRSTEMRRQRREHESALLRAARLEIEPLKKSLQPHFL